jgi:hypothetical protein
VGGPFGLGLLRRTQPRDETRDAESAHATAPLRLSGAMDMKVRAEGAPTACGQKALRFAEGLWVNSFGIHEKPNGRPPAE